MDPDFAEQLHFVALHLLRLVRKQEASALSPAGLSALEVVVREGPLPVGDLAKRERVRSPTMVRVLDELVRRELVKKEPSDGDKRVTLVRATRKGGRQLEQDREAVRRALARAVSEFRKPESAGLGECVATLYRVFSEGARP